MSDYVIDERDINDINLSIEILKELIKRKYKSIPREMKDVFTNMDLCTFRMKRVRLYDVIILPYQKSLSNMRGKDD